jgi:hypothetical protein
LPRGARGANGAGLIALGGVRRGAARRGCGITMQVTELPAEGLKRAFQVVVPAASLAERRDKRLKQLGRICACRASAPARCRRRRQGALRHRRLGRGAGGERERGDPPGHRRPRPAPGMQPKIELVNYSDGADLEYKLDLELLPEIPMPDFAASRSSARRPPPARPRWTSSWRRSASAWPAPRTWPRPARPPRAMSWSATSKAG